LLTCFSKDIILLLGPYSFVVFKICRAYADVGHSVLCILSSWHLMYLLCDVRYIRCHDPLLNPFEEFYTQSYYRHNKLLPEQNTRTKPNTSADSWPSYYVTPKRKVDWYACLPTYLPHLNTIKALNLQAVQITDMYHNYHSICYTSYILWHLYYTSHF